MQNMRRVPCSFLPLFHIHRHAGFEFHNEFILKDSDLFNQPTDKLLIKFGNEVRLLMSSLSIDPVLIFSFSK